jgi:hypothetical protein
MTGCPSSVRRSGSGKGYVPILARTPGIPTHRGGIRGGTVPPPGGGLPWPRRCCSWCWYVGSPSTGQGALYLPRSAVRRGTRRRRTTRGVAGRINTTHRIVNALDIHNTYPYAARRSGIEKLGAMGDTCPGRADIDGVTRPEQNKPTTACSLDY